MTTMRRQRLEKGVRQADETWTAYQLTVQRYVYDIMPEPTGAVARVRRIPLTKSGPAPWPPGGVFVPRDWPDQAVVENYCPTDEAWAKRLFVAVQRVKTESEEALLAFVNQWGVLGVGVPGDRSATFDGVQLTAMWIKKVQGWLEAWYALKRGEETPAAWDTLAMFLSGALHNVHPAVEPVDGGFRPVFHAGCLGDAILLALWNVTTEGGQLRRCPECRALFVPGRANQAFCARLCANRPTVRRAKKKRRQALLRLRRLEGAGKNVGAP